MEPILRAAVIYAFVLVIIRVAGKRTLSEATTFDFVLLLIIGEAAQQALMGDDFSLTNAFLVITTLVLLDILLSLAKRRSAALERWIDGTPVVILRDGRPLKEILWRMRMDESDILEAARRLRGIERMDDIKYAVLEKDGRITIIPRQP